MTEQHKLALIFLIGGGYLAMEWLSTFVMRQITFKATMNPPTGATAAVQRAKYQTQLTILDTLRGAMRTLPGIGFPLLYIESTAADVELVAVYQFLTQQIIPQFANGAEGTILAPMINGVLSTMLLAHAPWSVKGYFLYALLDAMGAWMTGAGLITGAILVAMAGLGARAYGAPAELQPDRWVRWILPSTLAAT